MTTVAAPKAGDREAYLSRNGPTSPAGIIVLAIVGHNVDLGFVGVAASRRSDSLCQHALGDNEWLARCRHLLHELVMSWTQGTGSISN